MAIERHTTYGAERARGLIILLPGYGDRPREFVRRGFVDRLRRSSAHYDIVAPDAHFGYYRTATLMERLAHDVIAPAQAAGYREIWLVGVSMGGFGALSYAARHEREITGVLALAPYLGDRTLLDEIEAEGGLQRWEPDLDVTFDPRERFVRELWAWFKEKPERPGPPSVFLAWGSEDSLARPARWVAKTLPNGHTDQSPGGHGWKIWFPLFDRWVTRTLEAPPE